MNLTQPQARSSSGFGVCNIKRFNEVWVLGNLRPFPVARNQRGKIAGITVTGFQRAIQPLTLCREIQSESPGGTDKAAFQFLTFDQADLADRLILQRGQRHQRYKEQSNGD
jgi:hypothetical protein